MKKIQPDWPRYRLKRDAPIHFANGRRYRAGAEVPLHPDIRPNKWMDKVQPAEAEKPGKPEKSDKSNTKAE